jgi:hypothetical protein
VHILISDWYEKWGGSLIQEPVRYLKNCIHQSNTGIKPGPWNLQNCKISQNISHLRELYNPKIKLNIRASTSNWDKSSQNGLPLITNHHKKKCQLFPYWFPLIAKLPQKVQSIRVVRNVMPCWAWVAPLIHFDASSPPGCYPQTHQIFIK